MGPREHREEMTSERVIPRRTELDDCKSVVFQITAHNSQHSRWIGEMLERIQRKDYVGPFLCFSTKHASIGNAAVLRSPTSFVNQMLAEFETNHLCGASLRKLDCFSAGPAAEIDHRFAADLGPDLRPEQNLQLATASISAAVAVAGLAVG